MDWILENWQLLASALLAVANLVITLCVHGSSRDRINALEDKDGNGIPDQLEDLLQINKELLEKLEHAKKDQQKGKQ